MEFLKLPQEVEFILDRLSDSGYETYVVGGCVRDSIMGISPNDWDICTSAMPEQIIDAFSDQKVIETGLKHGTVTVVINNGRYEVTTFRVDGEYKDNRHPDGVEFVRDLKQDLMRRDFTINALAYNHDVEIVDYFGGIEDIKNGVIKCVGNPNDRFMEDALRILRAIRFAAKLGFTIEPETRSAMLCNKELLKNVSYERINSELTKTLSNSIYKSADLMPDLFDLISVLVPEMLTLNKADVVKRLENTIFYEVKVALLFDFENSMLNTVLRRLKFPNVQINTILEINKYGRVLVQECKMKYQSNSVTDFASDNMDYLNDGYLSKYGARKLLCGKSPKNILLAAEYAYVFFPDNPHIRRGIVEYELLLCELSALNSLNSPRLVTDLMIDGNDLIKLGYSGTEIGKVMRLLLDLNLREIISNDHYDLMNVAKSLKTFIF